MDILTNIFLTILYIFNKIIIYFYIPKRYYKIYFDKHGICFPIMCNNKIYFITNNHLIIKYNKYRKKKISINYNKYKLTNIYNFHNDDLLVFTINCIFIKYYTLVENINIYKTYYIFYKGNKYETYITNNNKIKIVNKRVSIYYITTKLQLRNGLSGMPVYTNQNQIIGLFWGIYKKKYTLLPSMHINKVIKLINN